MILTIQLILIFIGGVAKGCMDKVQFHFGKSIFKNFNENYFNPKVSCNNKYKNGIKEQGEAFFLSTSVLVFLTDFWHLAQWVFLNSIFLAFALSTKITPSVFVDFFILRFTLGGPFWLFYNKLLTTKK
jgi:hypothetical protein